MTTSARILGFLVVLGAVFGLAFGAGGAVGPLGETDRAEAQHEPDHGSDHGADEGGGGHAGGAVGTPGGLSMTESGHTLRLERDRVQAGPGVRVAFTIEGPDGAPVTAYDVEHGKRLHLIAVRRDLTGYQHVHPVLDPDGTWSTRLDVSAGTWRLFADANPTGATGLILGADLSVAGRFRPAGPVPDTRTDRVDDYTVAVEGELEPGHASELTFTVRRDGRAVTDLQPYLGAYGHLVALREGDLAYLHVHPEGSPGDGSTTPGPDIGFVAEVPGAGRYRLFLDFRHAGAVRTAEIALAAGEEDR